MNAIKYIKPQNLLAPHLHRENLNVKIWEKYRAPMMRTEIFPLVYQESQDIEQQQTPESSTTNIHNINFFLKHFERILHTNLEDKTTLQSFFPLYSLQNIQKHTQKIAQHMRFFEENIEQKMFSRALHKQNQYLYKTSYTKNIIDSNTQRKSTTLQILNQPYNVKHVAKMLQVVNHLTYGMPAQYTEEIEKASPGSTVVRNTSENTLLQVLNNLAHQLPVGNVNNLLHITQHNVRGASYATLQRRSTQTKKMLQVANHLTYGMPAQYVEEIEKTSASNYSNIFRNTSGNTLLQVLNNLAYMLPAGNVNLSYMMPQQNVRGASYLTLQRRSTQTQKMLQVANHLTYGMPAQYTEEIEKALPGNTVVRNTSGNTLLQVLNNLAYMLPAGNVNLSYMMPQQNVRGASYLTLQRRSTQTQKMLQVANHLTYGMPAQYTEEIEKVSPGNTVVRNTSGNTLLQVLNNLAHVLPAGNVNNLSYTTAQQNVRGTLYATLQRKSAQTQKMLQVANHLTYGMPAQYVEEIEKTSAGDRSTIVRNTSGNMLLQVLNNLAHVLPAGNVNNLSYTMTQQNVRGASYATLQRKSVQTQKMLQVANHLTYGMPAQYIEEIEKTSAGDRSTIVRNTSGNTLLQVLNNLAHMLPAGNVNNLAHVLPAGNVNNLSYTTAQQNVRGASYATLQRKSVQTQKMLQVVNNLTYGMPAQYIEEIEKTSAGDRSTIVRSTSGNTLLQVLNNLAHMLPAGNVNNLAYMLPAGNVNNLSYMMPQQNVRGASYLTLQRRSTQTQKMLQVANHLTYGMPAQYIEEIEKTSAGDRSTIVRNTIGNTLLQVLNNLAHVLPAGNVNNLSYTTAQQNVRGASYATLQRKSVQTQKMLQVVNNLTYGMPAQYVEEIEKTSASDRSTIVRNTSGNTLLQVLNNLAHVLPAGNVNNLAYTMQQQNVRGASYATLQRKGVQTQKMLQVANHLTYGMPAQYIEEIEKTSAGDRSTIVRNTSGNTLLQVLNNLAHVLPAGNVNNLAYTMQPQNVRGASYSTLQRKSAQTQKMLQVVNNLTYGMPAQYIEEVENNSVRDKNIRLHTTTNTLLKVLNNLAFAAGNSKQRQKRVNWQTMLQVANHLTYKMPQTENNVATHSTSQIHNMFREFMYGKSVINNKILSQKNEQVLSQKWMNLQDRIANKFTRLHNKYFFTANNPLSHRVYVNQEIKPLETLSPRQKLQYKREPTHRYVPVQREPLPLKYKENPLKQPIVEQKKQQKNNHKTTHIHVSDAKINRIATRVYKILEKKMSIEKNRRGIF